MLKLYDKELSIERPWGEKIPTLTEGGNTHKIRGILPLQYNVQHCIVASNSGKLYNVYQKKLDAVELAFTIGVESIFKRGRFRL